MATSMALAFAEHGFDISVWDIANKNVDRALQMAKDESGIKGKIEGFYDNEISKFTKSLDVCERRLFIFSITHGPPADSVLEKLEHDLKKGDIIMDAGNEHYRSTERRQKELEPKGITWIGLGVSGGYQGARRGPSMSPGGDRNDIELVMPLLELFSAKDKKTGDPCVKYIGPRGSGHYVKMVHNGIEQGIGSSICEAWSLLHKSLGLSNDEIGKIFQDWNSEGELRNNFLMEIAAEIGQRKKTPKGDGRGEGVGDEGYVLDDVVDKVVQDCDDSEGTFFWSVAEAAERHVSAPTMSATQFLRVASANRAQRLKVADKLNIPEPQKASVSDKAAFVETLRKAVYTSVLCSFCQGLELIARTSADEGWHVDLATCIKIWRAGCIIRSEYVADMLEPIFDSAKEPMKNMKLVDEVASQLSKGYQPLKEIVLKGTEWDNYVPALSASLEYIKYCGGKQLPTQFMEAQWDFFGWHSYDKVGSEDDPGEVKKGKHHYEWRPA